MVPRRSHVRLAVYDLAGQRVRILVSEAAEPGSQTVYWDGRDQLGRSVASGIYIARVTVAAEAVSRKMVRLK